MLYKFGIIIWNQAVLNQKTLKYGIFRRESAIAFWCHFHSNQARADLLTWINHLLQGISWYIIRYYLILWKLHVLFAGPVLGQHKQRSCIGPRAYGGPAPPPMLGIELCMMKAMGQCIGLLLNCNLVKTTVFNGVFGTNFNQHDFNQYDCIQDHCNQCDCH